MMKTTPQCIYVMLLFVVAFLFIGATLFNSSHAQAVAGSAVNDPSGNNQENADINLAGLFFILLSEQDPILANTILKIIKENWRDELIPMALEVVMFSQSGVVNDELIMLVQNSTNKDTTNNINDWYSWLWNQDVSVAAGYADFKADLYLNIDPRFEQYFRGRQDSSRIRLDEIRWGGIGQDGIPPLRNPEMISAKKATYLDDDNIVFGMEINGDARAYPKRILAWHEMFTDAIGGVDIAGVYCTLCGTVIPYKTEHKGVKYQLGTSGFLYRSNKLMYDKATQSLWSTARGAPVLGLLVDKGIELEFESVVTTTWGEWRKRHPDTTVLSLKTGHQRDYGEGVAYAGYFATDELMFNTPFNDDRLANKREVLALRFAAAPNQQLAIDTKFLNENFLYEGVIGQQKFVVVTDKSGANRVYDPKDIKFASYDQNQELLDEQGTIWKLQEAWIEAPNGEKLPRLPYHRAFWFGWRAALSGYSIDQVNSDFNGVVPRRGLEPPRPYGH